MTYVYGESSAGPPFFAGTRHPARAVGRTLESGKFVIVELVERKRRHSRLSQDAAGLLFKATEQDKRAGCNASLFE